MQPARALPREDHLPARKPEQVPSARAVKLSAFSLGRLPDRPGRAAIHLGGDDRPEGCGAIFHPGGRFAVLDERHLVAIGRKRRVFGEGEGVPQIGKRLPVEIDDADQRLARAIFAESDLSSIGRPDEFRDLAPHFGNGRRARFFRPKADRAGLGERYRIAAGGPGRTVALADFARIRCARDIEQIQRLRRRNQRKTRIGQARIRLVGIASAHESERFPIRAQGQARDLHAVVSRVARAPNAFPVFARNPDVAHPGLIDDPCEHRRIVSANQAGLERHREVLRESVRTLGRLRMKSLRRCRDAAEQCSDDEQ